jgi:hypothetical protein
LYSIDKAQNGQINTTTDDDVLVISEVLTKSGCWLSGAAGFVGSKEENDFLGRQQELIETGIGATESFFQQGKK